MPETRPHPEDADSRDGAVDRGSPSGQRHNLVADFVTIWLDLLWPQRYQRDLPPDHRRSDASSDFAAIFGKPAIDRFSRGGAQPATVRLRRQLEPFRVDVHHERDTVRVAPVGELDLAAAPQLEERLNELVEAGFCRVVLDLSQLQFIDSAGIRLLLAHKKLAGDSGREFLVIPGPPSIQRILKSSGVLHRRRLRRP